MLQLVGLRRLKPHQYACADFRQAKEPLAKLNFDRMNIRYGIERTDAETPFQS